MIWVSCFFMGNSPFEFAILCVIALARCPSYSGRDVTGPGAYSPGNLCEFVRSFARPLSKGIVPKI